ncbi:MAG: hypothetical protein SF029_24035 [bacterium]|nr:hypothetical protein [bacterium]
MDKSWGWHSSGRDEHGWHYRGWHNKSWAMPALGFLFLFLVFKGWFIFPLLFALFFVLPALKYWNWGDACDTDDGEKRKRQPRFVNVGPEADDDMDEDSYTKRKNDDIRYV